jgi:hypothetical protein
LAVLLLASCTADAKQPVSGTMAGPAAPVAQQSAAAPQSPAVAQSPQAANAPVRAALKVTGKVSATVDGATAVAPCVNSFGSFYFRLVVPVGGNGYTLSVTIPDYTGPATYNAPPARVSMRPLQSDQPVLYAGTSGKVTVNSDQRSGTLTEVLQSQNDSIDVDGSWQCA